MILSLSFFFPFSRSSVRKGPPKARFSSFSIPLDLGFTPVVDQVRELVIVYAARRQVSAKMEHERRIRSVLRYTFDYVGAIMIIVEIIAVKEREI